MGFYAKASFAAGTASLGGDEGIAEVNQHRLVLLGPPASGKGTAAKRLSEMLGVTHVSTGQMFRDAALRGGSLGNAVGKFIDKGQFVPDEMTMQVVRCWLEAEGGRDGFIMDGFPRTIGQARAFDELMRQRGQPVTSVLLIELTKEETLRRVLGRLTCGSCGALYHRDFVRPARAGLCDKCGGNLTTRADDTEATVRERLKVYRQLTLDVVRHYEHTGLLKRVDGNLGKEAVLAAALEATRS